MKGGIREQRRQMVDATLKQAETGQEQKAENDMENLFLNERLKLLMKDVSQEVRSGNHTPVQQHSMMALTAPSLDQQTDDVLLPILGGRRKKGIKKSNIYNFIENPISGKKVLINSYSGEKILKKYLRKLNII